MARAGSTRVRSTPQRVAGVQAKLVQDASNERVEGLEPVAIRTASKRQRVRPRKSLKDERILRDVGLEAVGRQTPVRDTTGEMITQCNRREVAV